MTSENWLDTRYGGVAIVTGFVGACTVVAVIFVSFIASVDTEIEWFSSEVDHLETRTITHYDNSFPGTFIEGLGYSTLLAICLILFCYFCYVLSQRSQK